MWGAEKEKAGSNCDSPPAPGMGARISQTNVYAISTLVTTSEWDVENILRMFERRRAKWMKMEVNGKLLEWVPHTANPPDPAFLLAEDYEEEGEEDDEVLAIGLPPPMSPPPNGGDVMSVDARSKASIPNSRDHHLHTALGEGSIAGQSVSPLPSFFEGGELEDDPGVDLPLQAQGKTGGGGSVVIREEASWQSNRTRLPASYNISRETLKELLHRFGVNASDSELLDKMFSLVDTRGFGETDLRDIMLAYCLVVAKESIGQFLTMLFRTFDRSESFAIERREMLRLFTLVNECIFYFGDRPLEPRHVRDLVDSVFTTAGKIDGHVNWTDYIELIDQHPIVEMFFSMQYQGLAREKVFDDSSLAEMTVTATFDYSRESKPL